MSLSTRQQACRRCLQLVNASSKTSIRRTTTSQRTRKLDLTGHKQVFSRPGKPNQSSPTQSLPESEEAYSSEEGENLVRMLVDRVVHRLNPILLRDMCSCSSCIDPSTKQKLFATTDIPGDIKCYHAEAGPGYININWRNDVPGYDRNHVTRILTVDVSRMLRGHKKNLPHVETYRTLWDRQKFTSQTQDIDYESYMNDDSVLLQALKQLHVHGLMFLTNVPDSENSVETIGERIGPLKTTFYGRTWDVKSVPDAVNVAYTSQNLGFHMDLMYLRQPPHLQLLHCIRSSAKGGASLFTDSFKSAFELARNDPSLYQQLCNRFVNYHYDHPGSQYYRQARPVIEQKSAQYQLKRFNSWQEYESWQGVGNERAASEKSFTPLEFIESIAWSPPFQAPFSLQSSADGSIIDTHNVDYSVNRAAINTKMAEWHKAATEFNKLIHRQSGVYERLMKPGECVIFDNRRVLHARKAFEVGDAGTERWLRGAYLDKDPYISKWKVLTDQLTPACHKPSYKWSKD